VDDEGLSCELEDEKEMKAIFDLREISFDSIFEKFTKFSP